jgi:SAM-dependent methyltransferase
MVDIRPLSLEMESIKFVEGSILNLDFPDKSVESISSLCVIEHIGLGRYGDPLDPEGSIKAFLELMRVVKPGGNLFISFPIEEKSKTYFNAHRAFDEQEMLAHADEFHILDKKYIFGTKFTHEYSPEFGVGCYWLQRKAYLTGTSIKH